MASLLLPIVAGWYVVRALWPSSSLALRFAFGVATGFGLAGTVYSVALVTFDSARIAFGASETILAGVLVWSVLSNSRRPRNISPPGEPSNRLTRWAFIAVGLAGGAVFAFFLDLSRRGGWDALAMWNLRARLVASSSSPLSAILDSAFSGLHPDYPLLMPSLLARGWQYSGLQAMTPPILVAGMFTATVALLTFGAVRQLSTNLQSWISGAVLVGTPFLLTHGASQYADIVLCCFMTAAVVAYSLYDADLELRHLPLLAGISAGAAAFTKNEGILFLVVLVIARLLKHRGLARLEFFQFATGAFTGVLALGIFKFLYAPPSEFFVSMQPPGSFSMILSPSRHLEVLRGMRDGLSFGQWSLNPVPLMALHAASGSDRWRQAGTWFTAAFVVVGMLCGYYLLYLVSPYDVESHIQSSLDRLMLQLWPSIVLLYSMLAAPQGVEPSQRLSKTAIRKVVIVLVLVVSILSWSFLDQARPSSISPTPQIEVNRKEVRAGESYSIKVTGVASSQVFVSYSLDGTPMGQFAVFLGRDGTAQFPVSAGTRKGTYSFLAVRDASKTEWIRVATDAVITVK